MEGVHGTDDAVGEPQRGERDREGERNEQRGREQRAPAQELAGVMDRLVGAEELRADRLVAHPVLHGERGEAGEQQREEAWDHPAELPAAVGGIRMEQAERRHGVPHSSSASS